MADETPHRHDMSFRQPCYITAEAFGIRRTQPAGHECVEQARLADWFRQIPSFKPIRFQYRHGVVLDRQHLASDIARPDVAAAGDRLQPLPEYPWRTRVPE